MNAPTQSAAATELERPGVQIGVLEAIKRAVDPQGVVNPGALGLS